MMAVGDSPEQQHPVAPINFEQPKRGESFSSYLVRLTDMNYYDRLSWIPSLFGVSFFAFKWTQMVQVAEGMEKAFPVPKGAIISTVFRPHPETKTHLMVAPGEAVLAQHITAGAVRYCPACLDDYGYFLKVWEFKLVGACPVHRCSLITKCMGCGKPISRSRTDLLYCSVCGADLRHATPSKASKNVVLQSQLICAKASTPYVCHVSSCISAVWAEQSLADILTAIAFLFRYHTSRRSKANLLDRPEVSNLIMPIVLGWPQTYHSYVEDIHEQRLAKALVKTVGVRQALGPFYFSLIENHTSLPLQLLKDELSRYVASVPDKFKVTGRGRCAIHRPAISFFLTKAETCARLGISPETFDRLVKRGIFFTQPFQIGKQIVHRIDAGLIALVEDEIKQSLSIEDSAGVLGISQSEVFDALQRGYLIKTLGWCRSGNLALRIKKDSIEDYKYDLQTGKS